MGTDRSIRRVGRTAELVPSGNSLLLSHAIEQLRGKWKLRILWKMRTGPVRLGKLSRELYPASKKVLTESLRQLQSSGLIVRSDKGGAVRHVEYALAEPLRNQLVRLLDHLADFGAVHFADKSINLEP
jgi:DNA-binding HxlR family transcriptional regulator